MRRVWWRALAGALIILGGPAGPVGPRAQAPSASLPGSVPISYRVTFPEPEHHWMQVEVTISNPGSQPLDVRMSRSSPGRYAVSEFAKNVFWIEAYDSRNQKLPYTRPEADIWRI